MRIARASVTPIRLPLATPVTTAHGTLSARDGALLSLTGESGDSGWGESLPLPGFGLESVAESIRALERVARELLASGAIELCDALDAVERLTPRAKSARAACDAALYDLAARAAGSDVATLLGAARRERVAVNALVHGDSAETAAAGARRAIARGFRTLKLKLGAFELARDEDRVAAVRDAAGADVLLRLDANGAWQEATALEAAERMARYAIEFLEQPVAAADFGALRRVRAAASIPIAADEAVRDEASAEELLDSGAADLLVIKPAAVGGLRAAARIARRACAAGVGVAVTSLLDSSLGIAAALQLAAALPDARFAAGLATADVLAEDLAPAFPVECGAIALPAEAGLGRAPDPAALRRCATGAARELRA